MKRIQLSALGLMTVLSGMAIAPAVWAHGDEHIDPNMKVDHPIEARETDFGRQGMTREVTRTIDISMGDMLRMIPDNLEIAQGETVRLRIRNDGTASHVFVLGTRAEIARRADLLMKNPGTEYADASAISAAPGKTSEIIWQFTKPGTFLYACVIPGHWEMGMQGMVTVTGPKAEALNASATGSRLDRRITANDNMKSIPVPPDSGSPAASDDRYTQGAIRKVDAVQGKLTIKHGDIRNLGMPGMTMVFTLKDKALLQGLKVGDNVAFVARMENGALMITEIRKVEGADH